MGHCDEIHILGFEVWVSQCCFLGYECLSGKVCQWREGMVNYLTRQKSTTRGEEICFFSEDQCFHTSSIMLQLSRVWLFVTPWTVARQAPLSVGFSGQEYWNGLSFPTPGIFQTQGPNPHLLRLLHWQVDSLSLCHQGRMRGEGINSIGILILCFK